MEVIKLAEEDVYYNIYDITSLVNGDSFTVSNTTSDPLYIVRQALAPDNDLNFQPIQSGKDGRVVGDGENVWIKGNEGPIVIQSFIPEVSSYQGVDLPRDVYSIDKEGFRRIRVEVDRTGFFDGREFRVNRKLIIPSNTTIWWKFTSATDFMLIDQFLEIDEGGIEFRAYDDSGVVGTPFTTPVNILAENTMSFSPAFVSAATVTSGGTYTPSDVDDYKEILRVRTSNATAQRQSVGGGSATERGRPASTTYLQFENFTNGPATAVYSLVWQELPFSIVD